jgi:hypothetical protein
MKRSAFGGAGTWIGGSSCRPAKKRDCLDADITFRAKYRQCVDKLFILLCDIVLPFCRD